LRICSIASRQALMKEWAISARIWTAREETPPEEEAD